MKYILSLMLLIASIFMAQSAFAATPMIQEALIPPDTFVTSAISAPAVTLEFTYEASPMVTTSDNKLSHLNPYIINKSDEIPVQDILMPVGHFREVETVLKFPCLIHKTA